MQRHRERRQRSAGSSSSPLRQEPHGVAAGQESNKDSHFLSGYLEVEKGVAQAKLLIARAEVLESAFRSDIPRRKRILLRGAWVAQLVKHLTSAQVVISWFGSSSPASSSALMVDVLLLEYYSSKCF